ncbi:uncharacterized protein LOC122082559 isoform X2 [Macadamia integrifolia]|uniref:uncharacterized protein LOC122082559 isoform X2 n=1 Tax=Macadamia integrifolia TaxID=60698 RepID=UPI001C4EE762|nr:uncharacterized protein LOC122082559 isoform X2 [Macadamia integrifolia]
MGEEVEDPYSKWVEDCRYSSSQEQLFTTIECDLPVNLSYHEYYNPKSWYRGEGSSSSSKNQNGKSPADMGKGLSPLPLPRMDSSVDEDDVVVAGDESLRKVSHSQMEWETTAQVVRIERGDTSSSVFHCALNSREDIIDLFPEIAGEIPLDNSKKTGEGFGSDIRSKKVSEISSEATQVSSAREEDDHVDILEIAKKRGLKFFRPRWWPEEEEEEEL